MPGSGDDGCYGFDCWSDYGGVDVGVSGCCGEDGSSNCEAATAKQTKSTGSAAMPISEMAAFSTAAMAAVVVDV